MKLIYFILVVFLVALALVAVGTRKASADDINCPTDTPTSTPITPTPTDTPVPPSPTPTDTEIPSATPTDTPTEIPTLTATPTSTSTDVPTDTPTQTPTDTATDTPEATPTFTTTASPTDTPANTPTSTPITNTPTITQTKDPRTETPTITPSDTPVTPTDTPTPVYTPSTTSTPTRPSATETPYPPQPAIAAMHNLPYPSSQIGVMSLSNYEYQLYLGVNAPDGSLMLPNIERSAAVYQNTIWVHRIWEDDWLRVRAGDTITITMPNDKAHTYKVVNSIYIAYGVYPEADRRGSPYQYIASCYSDSQGWKGVILYQLQPIRNSRSHAK